MKFYFAAALACLGKCDIFQINCICCFWFCLEHNRRWSPIYLLLTQWLFACVVEAAAPVAAFAPRPALTLRASSVQAPLSQSSASDRSAVATAATKRENEFHWNMNENRPPWGEAPILLSSPGARCCNSCFYYSCSFHPYAWVIKIVYPNLCASSIRL